MDSPRRVLIEALEQLYGRLREAYKEPPSGEAKQEIRECGDLVHVSCMVLNDGPPDAREHRPLLLSTAARLRLSLASGHMGNGIGGNIETVLAGIKQYLTSPEKETAEGSPEQAPPLPEN
jgi:hypothetical protein